MYSLLLHMQDLLGIYIEKGAAMVKWLSSWLAEQEVRGSIPGLATWISEIVYLLLRSRDMAEIPLKGPKSSIQLTNQPINIQLQQESHCWKECSVAYQKFNTYALCN